MPNDIQTLKKKFNTRWKSLEDGTNLPLPDKEKLWGRLLICFELGLKCEYCGVPIDLDDNMEPYTRQISLDHRTPREHGGDNSLDNLAWVCVRCNHLKSTMCADTYTQLISPFLINQQFLDQMYLELHVGRLAYKLEREGGEQY